MQSDPNRAPVTTRVSRTDWWMLLSLGLWLVGLVVAFAIGRCCR